MRAFAGAMSIVTVLTATPALAVSGSDLLSMDPSFAKGYIWGVTEYRSMVADSDDPAEGTDAFRVMSCLMRGNITSSTMYEAVIAHIKNNPGMLTGYGVAAVLQVIARMCPSQ